MRFSDLSLALLAALALVVAGCGDGRSGGTSRAAPDTFAMPNASTASSTRLDSLDAGPILSRSDFDLSKYEGEVVLLNFWATWCAPCRAEMPDLTELQRDLGGEGLQIIGVATDRQGRDAVAPYLKRRPVNYPNVLDPGQEIGATYGGMAALPTTLIIGPEGGVRQRIVGRMRPGPLRERLEGVLAEVESNAAEAPS